LPALHAKDEEKMTNTNESVMLVCDACGADVRVPKCRANLARFCNRACRVKRFAMDEESRFLSLVEKIPESGCWIFTGKSVGNGYGSFHAFGRKTVRAHRWAYAHFVGQIPDGLQVRHSCDVACCVNPKHLIPGTHRENMDDMARRKRRATGVRSGVAKLNDEQVRQIRSRLNPYQHGIYVELAKEYGVDRSIIARIDSGKLWRHVS
jgi:hypothetical protein